MQLKIQRSQRQGGLSGKVIFWVDARIFLTAEEQANVSRYRLGGQVIYNSQASHKHLDKANEAVRQGSYLKSLASVAMAALNLNITISVLPRWVMRGSGVRVTQAAPVFLASQHTASLSIVSTSGTRVSHSDSAIESAFKPVLVHSSETSDGNGFRNAVSSTALNRNQGAPA
jgi:hypothetical protein